MGKERKNQPFVSYRQKASGLAQDYRFSAFRNPVILSEPNVFGWVS